MSNYWLAVSLLKEYIDVANTVADNAVYQKSAAFLEGNAITGFLVTVPDRATSQVQEIIDTLIYVEEHAFAADTHPYLAGLKNNLYEVTR